jgi:hypothetical protein
MVISRLRKPIDGLVFLLGPTEIIAIFFLVAPLSPVCKKDRQLLRIRLRHSVSSTAFFGGRAWRKIIQPEQMCYKLRKFGMSHQKRVSEK